ncbi:MAG: hypothetical protein ACLR1G_12230 [Alistipes indistinctus]
MTTTPTTRTSRTSASCSNRRRPTATTARGNPIAATDGSAKTASEFFADSQRLKSYTTPSGAKHTLGYDASNNLREDTLAGLTNYTYHNTSGSPTTSMTRRVQRRLPQVPKCLRQYRPFPHGIRGC